MDRKIEQNNWTTFLKEFNKRNGGRPTRLEVFGEEIGVETEEHGFPLSGIDIEMKGKDSPSIEIMLGGKEQDLNHLTHVITNVKQIMVKEGEDENETILEIESQDNVKTLLYIEPIQKIGKSQ